jgi:hypothetical protein
MKANGSMKATQLICRAAIALLCGCATTVVSTEDAAPVPLARIMVNQWSAAAPGTGGLIIKRDRGFMAGGCGIKLFIDGNAIAVFEPSEKLNLFLPLGKHLLGADGVGLCKGNLAETSVTIEPDHVAAFRISVQQSGDLRLQPTAF